MLGAGAQGGILLCLLPCSHQSRQGGKDRTQGSGASASQSEGEGLFVPQALYATPPHRVPSPKAWAAGMKGVWHGRLGFRGG